MRAFRGSAPFALALGLLPAAAWASSGGGASHKIAFVALALAVVLVAAKLGGDLAVRVGQQAVLGELFAGMVLGNLPARAGLGWLRDDPSIDVLAQLGSLVLLFEVGLALKVRDVLAVRGAAAAVALLGTVSCVVLGWLASAGLHPEQSAVWHLFLGASIAATSIGITARVLRDLGKTRTQEASIILSAAIVDDVLGLVLLGVVTGWIEAEAEGSGHLAWASLGWIVLRAAAFFVVASVVGLALAPPFFVAASKLRSSGTQVAAGLIFCFAYAWAADALGLAPIVGAFTAGLFLEEAHSAGFAARGEPTLGKLVEPVSSFLVPVFFVLMGIRVRLGALVHPRALVVAGVLLLAAVLGKLACALGARGASRLAVAAGMMPRGEVTLIYASLGSSTLIEGKPLLDEPLYAALVLVIVATTVGAPPALKWALGKSAGGAA